MITKFISGYYVEYHKCKSGVTLLTVSKVKPGGNINSPEWVKDAFIHEECKNLGEVFDSVVNYIANIDIPKNGYAKITI